MIRDWDGGGEADEWDELERTQEPWVNRRGRTSPQDAGAATDDAERQEKTRLHPAHSARGTVHVRETIKGESRFGAGIAPPWAQSTPGAGGGLKDMFTPLSLETLFYHDTGAASAANAETMRRSSENEQDRNAYAASSAEEADASKFLGRHEAPRDVYDHRSHDEIDESISSANVPYDDLHAARSSESGPAAQHGESADDAARVHHAANSMASEEAVSFGISASNILNHTNSEISPPATGRAAVADITSTPAQPKMRQRLQPRFPRGPESNAPKSKPGLTPSHLYENLYDCAQQDHRHEDQHFDEASHSIHEKAAPHLTGTPLLPALPKYPESAVAAELHMLKPATPEPSYDGVHIAYRSPEPSPTRDEHSSAITRGHESLFQINYDTRTRRYLKSLVDELHEAPADSLTTHERIRTQSDVEHEYTEYPDATEDEISLASNRRLLPEGTGEPSEVEKRVLMRKEEQVGDHALPQNEHRNYPSDIDFLDDAFDSSRRSSQRAQKEPAWPSPTVLEDPVKGITRVAPGIPASRTVSSRELHDRDDATTSAAGIPSDVNISDPLRKAAISRLFTIRNLNKGDSKASVMLSQLAAHSQMTFNEEKNYWEGPDGLIEDLLDEVASSQQQFNPSQRGRDELDDDDTDKDWELGDVLVEHVEERAAGGVRTEANRNVARRSPAESLAEEKKGPIFSPALVTSHKLLVEDLTHEAGSSAPAGTEKLKTGRNAALYGAVRGPRGSTGLTEHATTKVDTESPPPTHVRAPRPHSPRTAARIPDPPADRKPRTAERHEPNTHASSLSRSVLHARNGSLRQSIPSALAGGDMHAIQFLDISGNAPMHDLSALASLANLRELHAASNELTSCRGLIYLPRLSKANLRCNLLERLDFGVTDMPQMESLDVSCNQLTSIAGIEPLSALRELIVDQNRVSNLDLQLILPRLEILSMNDNCLTVFDAKLWPRLRKLALDRNNMEMFLHEAHLRRLKYLSVRDQNTSEIHIDFSKLIGLSDLHVSNVHVGPMHQFHDTVFMRTLELQRARIAEIPREITRRFQQLVHLNLRDNKISDLTALRHVKGLRSLCLARNCVADFGNVLKAVRKMTRLEVLDLRGNPVTERFYPSTDLDVADWERVDEDFARALCDADYVRRAYYRSSAISVLRGSLRLLDNVSTAETDIEKAKVQLSKLRVSLRRSLNESKGP
ncbi:hypothetical protein HDU90_004958 [Geranomyces variabilis]|nr:hypothetical protein HDU90_004958 [Geranomyces variabilis]